MDTQNQEMVRDPQPHPEHVRAERRVAPPVDVYENQEEILLVVDVPGVDQDGLNVHLEGGQLALEARQPTREGEELGFEPMVYARSFTVPNTVDAGKVAAKLDMGVLHIHLPKSQAAKPRRIEVKAG